MPIDIPSIGHSSLATDPEDSSCLHQAVLGMNCLTFHGSTIHKVSLFGFRFGGNAMVRVILP
ncbi:alpha/beta hydrolase [Vibrio lentus]|nr:alpha/beta hydrolase [Vibrio lentus]